MKKIEKGGIQGATFGVMEASIMMLGVLFGLSVTGNKFIISLGLLTAGIADAIANTASFYVSEESEMIHPKKEIWKSTFYCFLGTFLTVIAIVLPLFIFNNINYGILSSFAIGLIILFGLGVYMAKHTKAKKKHFAITKYVVIGIAAAVICFLLGKLINMFATTI